MTSAASNLSQRFPQKRAFITGAASGLGLACAEILAREGWQLFLTDVDGPRLDLVAAGLARDGARVAAAPCDVRDADAVRAIVDAAVAAGKAAFPAWAGLAATERARLVRKLGELIAQHVPEIAQTETNDTGQVIAQTGKQLVPRAADNFSYFAEMCTRVDGHTYPTPTHLNYTLFHPVGVCALISPWNVPFMTATWKEIGRAHV